MKKYLLSLVTCFLVSLLVAQESKKEEKIDSKIEKSVTALASFLTAESKSEKEKVEAIHTWITNNIAYDYKLIESDKSFQYESATKVLKDKKALCTGYVRLMREMLDAVGVLSVYVPGYTYAHKEFYKPEVLLDNHAWIAIKIEGEWYMADPTWDAGYIGSLEAEKLREKLDKKNAKIGKKNLKFKEAKKDTLPPLNVDSILAVKNPTGKTGFIFNPSKDWFLVDMSEFSMRHLPANPMWQLRNNIISVPEFLKADSTLKNMLTSDANSTQDYDYKTHIDTFLSKSFIEQVAFMGTDAYDFYSENKRVKAYYYYYFLSIINEKEIQKEIKEFDLSQTYRLRRMVSQITDSALHYAKLSEKVEKERFKALGGFYKDIDKTSQTNGKYFVKMAAKSLTWNDKIIQTIEKRSEKLPSQIQKLTASGGQYHKAKDLELQWAGDIPELVVGIVDSTAAIKNRWQTAVNVWSERVENSALQQAYNFVDFNNYLLQRRMVFLGHKSISFNDYIDTVDVIVRLNLDTLANLYAKDIKEETFLDDAYKIVKELETYQKSVLLEMSKSELSDDEQSLVMMYVNKILSHIQSQQLIAAEEALAHNTWMYENLQTLSEAMVRFQKLAGDQERLTLDKNEYLVEQAEHEHKREEDLADVIQKKVKIWQDKNK